MPDHIIRDLIATLIGFGSLCYLAWVLITAPKREGEL